jgi:hypothetical protein
MCLPTSRIEFYRSQQKWRSIPPIEHFYALDLGKRVIKIPDRVPFRIDLTLRVPIPHELKPVLRPVRDLIVLIPDILQHLEKVQPAPRIDGRHWPMSLLVLEPRRTRRRPGEPLHQLVRMVLQLVDGFLLGLVRFDVLRLQLVDHLEHVPRVPFQDRE